MLTAEITNTVYENFITLNQGFSLGNNGAWLLLLNKVMGMVAQVRNNDLSRDDRVDLVVAVVIRYLDEKTNIADEQLQHITTSVRAMCLAMLGYGGELAGKKPTVRVPTDPELVSTPLHITQLLMNKLRELIRREPNATKNLGAFLPKIVMLCITTVNKFGNLTNLEKRNLVVNVIISFLDEYLAPRLTTPAQQISLGLFKADLGNMVDLFVGIAKDKPEYNFNYRDPVGRRNLLSCLGTGIVRAIAVLGLCFTRRQPAANTESSNQTTTNTVTTLAPINTITFNTEDHAEKEAFVETQILSSCVEPNNDLPSIPEETVSTHDEIVNDMQPPPSPFTEQIITVKKEEKLDADESLPPTPPSELVTGEIEPAQPFPDYSDSVSLVQVIINTISATTVDTNNDDIGYGQTCSDSHSLVTSDLNTTSDI